MYAFLGHIKTLLESAGFVLFCFNLVGFCFLGWREDCCCAVCSHLCFSCLFVCFVGMCERFFYTTARPKSFPSQDSNRVQQAQNPVTGRSHSLLQFLWVHLKISCSGVGAANEVRNTFFRNPKLHLHSNTQTIMHWRIPEDGPTTEWSSLDIQLVKDNKPS